jgi:hypothetical protein
MRFHPLLRAASVALVSAASLFSATGCVSYVPFTAELQTEHRLAPKDLQNLQFYTSQKITLRRELANDSRQITGSHKLLVIAGKRIEEVVIEKHTPGVIVGVGRGTLKVSFEEGSSLDFAVRGAVADNTLREPVELAKFAEAPNPFPGDSPRPASSEVSQFGSGDYFLLPDGNRAIEYQGQTYEAVDDSADAHLVISSESLQEEQQSQKVLKGRQL